MVSEEEFGSLVAEYEGFRSAVLDEVTELREEIEDLREEIKDIKRVVEDSSDGLDNSQKRLLK